MRECAKCVHWQRHYPNDGGICWKKDQLSVEGIQSTTASATGLGAIGETMAALFGHGDPMLVTRYDATCAGFTTQHPEGGDGR